MGIRFKNTKKLGTELTTVFIMIMTLGFVMFVYSPTDTEQIVYYMFKGISLLIFVPAYFAISKIRSRKSSSAETDIAK